MVLPLTGTITMSMVADEIDKPGQLVTLNDPEVRELTGIFDSETEISLEDLRGRGRFSDYIWNTGFDSKSSLGGGLNDPRVAMGYKSAIRNTNTFGGTQIGSLIPYNPNEDIPEDTDSQCAGIYFRGKRIFQVMWLDDAKIFSIMLGTTVLGHEISKMEVWDATFTEVFEDQQLLEIFEYGDGLKTSSCTHEEIDCVGVYHFNVEQTTSFYPGLCLKEASASNIVCGNYGKGPARIFDPRTKTKFRLRLSW